MTAPGQPKRLAFKTHFLTSGSPTPMPAGQPSPAGRWADWVSEPLFREACERAFGEYVCSLAPDPQTAATMAYRIDGAKGVLHVLLNLGEEQKPVMLGTGQKGLIPT